MKNKLRFSQLRTLVVLFTIYTRYAERARVVDSTDLAAKAHFARNDFNMFCAMYAVDSGYLATRLTHG